MAAILIIEDHKKDLRIADETARSAGFSEVEARADVDSASKYLEAALAADRALPDAILLDLDLGQESGYEILRIRYSTPRLAAIPVVVWTRLEDDNCDVCALFHINGYVSKWEGSTALRDALRKLRPEFSQE